MEMLTIEMVLLMEARSKSAVVLMLNTKTDMEMLVVRTHINRKTGLKMKTGSII